MSSSLPSYLSRGTQRPVGLYASLKTGGSYFKRRFSALAQRRAKGLVPDPHHKLPTMRPPRDFWGPRHHVAVDKKPETKPAPKQAAGPKGGAKGGKGGGAGWALSMYEMMLPPPMFGRPAMAVYAPNMSIGGLKHPEVA